MVFSILHLIDDKNDFIHILGHVTTLFWTEIL